MKEQEKYKQMMNEIHVSETTLRKVMEMDMNKKMLSKKKMMKNIGLQHHFQITQIMLKVDINNRYIEHNFFLC